MVTEGLHLQGGNKSIASSLADLEWDDDGVLRTYDREHGTAVNVAEFKSLLEEKGQFSADNMKKQYLCNLLGEKPVEVKDDDKVSALLYMREKGTKRLAVLVSRIVPAILLCDGAMRTSKPWG